VSDKDNERWYQNPWREDERWPSVTTILGAVANKPNLLEWRSREAARFAVENFDTMFSLIAEGKDREAIELAAAEPDRIAEKAADLGRLFHRLAEAHVKGEAATMTDDEAAAVKPFMESFHRFLEEKKPTFRWAEATVYHQWAQYAGTTDGGVEFGVPIPVISKQGKLVDLFPPGTLLNIDYKGLALDTPLPTPAGWTTMGAVQVGDEVFDSQGQPCRVVSKSEIHARRCYRIRFDDKSSVVCDDEHLWVTDSGIKREIGVRNTEEIRATLKDGRGISRHRVAIAAPLTLPKVDLPVHPYVLGCWIGDGTAKDGGITKPDAELFDLIEGCGYTVGPPIAGSRGLTRTVYGLRKQLRLAGLLRNKHIPDRYLRASAEQRLDLLRGLMDTDGSWNATRRQAVFSTTDKALAFQVRELMLSLGERAKIHEVQAQGFGLTVTAYPVTFAPVSGANPFRLSRKAGLVEWSKRSLSRHRFIVAVDETITVPTQCIAVDSPDRTYLCTESMIPTHNTGKSVWPETVAQQVAYSAATHMGIKDALNTVVPMPRVKGAAVVHIRPDGYRVHGVRVTPSAKAAWRQAVGWFHWLRGEAANDLGIGLRGGGELHLDDLPGIDVRVRNQLALNGVRTLADLEAYGEVAFRAVKFAGAKGAEKARGLLDLEGRTWAVEPAQEKGAA
jgi:hypothetical protein